MATTFTPWFNLGKPENGDLNWGPVINANFTTIDTALQSATSGSISASRLPVAGASALGVVKGFTNLSITAEGVLSLSSSNVTTALGFTPADNAKLGAANGIATLDSNGKVPTAQLSISTTDITEGTKLFFTTQRAADAAPVKSVNSKTGIISLTTLDIAESGANLYYSPERFDARLGSKTTDNLAEGVTNQYWSAAKFNSAFSAKTTDDLAQGSTNQYYTNGKVDNRIQATSRSFKTITDATGVFSVVAGAYDATLKLSAQPGISITFNNTEKAISIENTGVVSINGTLTGEVTNIAETTNSGKLKLTQLPSLVDPSKQSFAQLNAIGGLDAHAADSDTSDFFMNTEGAKEIRKIMVSSAKTPLTGIIEFDILVADTQGVAPVSLFPVTKPTLTCTGGAAWRILETTDLETVNIPNDAMVLLDILDAPEGAKDLRVELFEFIEVFHDPLNFAIIDDEQDPDNGGGSTALGAGYIALGGDITFSTAVATIDKFLFSDDSRSTLTTGLSSERYLCASFASSTKGYVAGGLPNGYESGVATIDKFLFSDDSRSTLSAGLVEGRFGAAGFSSSSAGYVAGNSTSASNTSSVKKFLFADESTSTLSSTLASATFLPGSFASNLAGYVAGGFNGSTNLSAVRKFIFTNDSGSTLAAELSNAQKGLSGFASSSAGYVAGADTGEQGVGIDKFIFSNDTRSGVTYGLSFSRLYLASFASSQAGYAAGGNYFNQLLASVEKLDFSNDSTSLLEVALSSGSEGGTGFAPLL